MDVLPWDLSLRFRNFLNKNPGHWFESCVGVITSTISGTISDPESHAHFAVVDVVTVPLNMADTMGIQFTTSFPQVYMIPSIGRGPEHSAPSKVKYQRLQQLSQL